MGREIRYVPKDWKHPEKDPGDSIPLLNGSYSKRVAEWDKAAATWTDEDLSYAEYSGERPSKEDYMPDWPDSEQTHMQMYETCTEGTPISPIFSRDEPEELAHWLADNNVSAFAFQGATYKEWFSMIVRSGVSISCIMEKNGIRSGVAALSKENTF